MSEYGIQIDITGDISQLRSALRGAETAINSFASRNETLFKKLDQLALPVAGAFAGLSVAIGVSLKQFGEFESKLQAIRAVSGATAKEIDAMRKSALELGATTRFSASEAADGMGELAKAGFTTKEVLASIPGVLSLAAAAGMGVGQAAEIAGGALRGFGLAADQAGRVADILAQSANKSSVDVTDLGESFKYIAPIASATGQDIEGMTSAISIMGNQMIKGSQAGTTIRAALTALLNPSTDAAKSLNALKISIQDTSGKMLPFEQIIGQLRTATAKMTDVQKSSTIANIFGAESLSGILALVNTSPAAYAEMTKSMHDSDGAAKDMADTMNQGLGPSIEAMKGAIETLGIIVGEKFAPAAKLAADTIGNIAGAIANLPDQFVSMGVMVVAAGTAFLGLVAVLTATGGVVALAATAIGALGLAAGPVIVTIGLLAAGVGVLTGALMNNIGKVNESKKAVQDHQEETNKLAQEFENLKNKANKTAEEHDRMKTILERLTEISPEIVTGYNNQGQATDINRVALSNLNDELRAHLTLLDQQAEKSRVSARQAVGRTRVEYYEARQQLSDLNKQIDAAMTEQTSVPGVAGGAEARKSLVGTRGLEDLKAMQRDATARLQSAERLMNDSMKTFIDQSPSMVYGPAYVKPDATAAPFKPFSTGKGNHKNAKPKGPDPRQALFQNLENDLQNRLKANSEIFKGGDAGEKAILVEFKAKLDAKAFAGFDPAIRKAKDLATQIDIVNNKINTDVHTKAAQSQVDALKNLFAIGSKFAEIQKQEQQNSKDLAKAARERSDIEDATANNQLDYFSRITANVKLGYRQQQDAAKQRYDDEMTRIDKLEKTLPSTKTKLRNEADDRLVADTAQITEGLKRSIKEVDQEWIGTLLNIGGAMNNLANDPSLEKVLNWALQMAAQPEQIEKISSALGKMGDMLKVAFNPSSLKGTPEAVAAIKANADDAYQSIVSMTTSFVEMSAVGAIVGGISYAFNGLMQAMDRVNKVQQDLIDGAKSYSQEVDAIQQRAQNGLFDNKTDERSAYLQNRLDYINELEGKLDELNNHEVTIFDLPFMDQAKRQAETVKKRIEEGIAQAKVLKTELAKAKVDDGRTDYNGSLAGINERLNKGVIEQTDADNQIYSAISNRIGSLIDQRIEAMKNGGVELAASINTEIDSLIPAFDKYKEISKNGLKETNKDIGSYVDNVKRLVGIDQELTESAHDAWGNKISLAEEASLKVSELKTDHQKKLNDLKREQADIDDRIAEINKKEKDDINAVLNEGYAVRAKSEIQDKTDRIDVIKAKADKDRKDAEQQKQDIKDKIALENDQFKKQKSYIQKIAQEKIDALNAERAAIDKTADAQARQLNLSRQMTYEMIKQAVLTGQTVDVNAIGSAIGYLNQASVPPKMHTGGIVAPGKPNGEFVRTLQGKEWVLQPEQLQQAMTNSAARALLQFGGKTANQVSVKNEFTIYAAEGMDEETLANIMASKQSDVLRRAGLPFS